MRIISGSIWGSFAVRTILVRENISVNMRALETIEIVLRVFLLVSFSIFLHLAYTAFI